MRFALGFLASIGLLMLCLLTSFNPAAPLNILARGGDWSVRTDHYGPLPRNGVDVYTPRQAADAPVIVFFYGGNWQSGTKETYRFVAASLAARGYVAVVPDYRVYPEARFDGFMQDGAQAVAWTKRNIQRFGGDPGRIFLMGHSAGAHIAAMLTLDGHWLADAGLNSRQDIAGLIGVAGPYDFLPLHDDTLETIFSGGDIMRTQPISFVAGEEPPALLVTGRADSTVDPGNTARLAARLRARGGDVTETEYASVGHLTIIGAFSPVLKLIAPVVDDVDRFVRRHSTPRTQSRQEATR
jgi:acetyl esterase/lipase